jgi:Domain of Unknown Function (DUF1080)
VRKRASIFLLPAVLVAAVTLPKMTRKPDDRSRPQPPVITPGTPSTEDEPGKPPSDATVLFGGKDLSAWVGKNNQPAPWKAADGYFEVAAGTGDIHTKQSFGDCQLHVEWAAPNPPHGTDQDRGNSGVYLMSLYEIQVLDSYHAITYPDGQAGAVYTQYPPLVNASRPPGAWQSYDIVFHGPRFSQGGELLRPATITLLHNGVLVQDHVTLVGPTAWEARPPYKAHPQKMPLLLQDHNHPVRFRNIWIRELREPAE